MENIVKSFKASHKSARKKRKPKKYDFLPYDPKLAEALPERFDIPKSWKLQPDSKIKSEYESLLTALRNRQQSNLAGQSDNAFKVRHLFARASFGLNISESRALAETPTADLVDSLLADTQIPQPPGEWVAEPFDFNEYRNWTQQERMAFLMLNRERIEELRAWWLELMMSSAFNLREKMTFFWHGHFTTDLSSAVLAQLLFKQNDTLRHHALGNFGSFLKAIYRDPAMLLYLDGNSNVATAPNENFARELLELFTMGVGNYTEQDIKEAARAFTGWQPDFFNITSFFNPTLHDYGSKTFLGQSGNFDGDDIIDIILQQPETAQFICKKLFEFFISRELDEPFIEDLAVTFRNNNHEIKPVMKKLLKSEQFYSEETIASLIKSPVDLTINNARMLSSESVNAFFVLVFQSLIDQEIMNPPNVAGWPGQRTWISPTTYVLRNTISEIYINTDFLRDRQTGEAPIEFDVMAFAQNFEIATARELAHAMIDHLLRIPVSDNTFEFLLTVLIGTAAENDWSLQYPGVDRLITEFLVQVVRLPEFHLS